MYDDSRRIVTMTPEDPSDKRMVQKGLWSWLLCENCEQLVNTRYEVPFFNYWYQGPGEETVARLGTGQLAGIPYEAFKLFHLSVIFRAHASDQANFFEVQMPEAHADRIRMMLLTADPGPAWQYPILVSPIDMGGKTAWDAVAPAYRIKVFGHWGYHFTFARCQWIYLVSSHPCPEIASLMLRPSGDLPFASLPWTPLRRGGPIRKKMHAIRDGEGPDLVE